MMNEMFLVLKYAIWNLLLWRLVIFQSIRHHPVRHIFHNLVWFHNRSRDKRIPRVRLLFLFPDTENGIPLWRQCAPEKQEAGGRHRNDFFLHKCVWSQRSGHHNGGWHHSQSGIHRHMQLRMQRDHLRRSCWHHCIRWSVPVPDLIPEVKRKHLLSKEMLFLCYTITWLVKTNHKRQKL